MISDYSELLSILNAHHVKYLVVGAPSKVLPPSILQSLALSSAWGARPPGSTFLR